jgi:hypothetical protein
MQARAASVDSLYIPGAQNILSVLIGANDLGGETTSFFLTNLASYLDARRTAGWYVILCTITSHSGGDPFNSNRAIVNPELRLWTVSGSIVSGQHCDRICDFAADPIMGPDGASANTTYFADGIHPTGAGQARLRDIMWPVLDAALSSPRTNPVIRTTSYSCEVGSADLTLNLRADRGVTWSIGGNPAITMNELFQLNLAASTLGSYQTVLTATDGAGKSSSVVFIWSVSAPPSGYGPNLLLNGGALNDLAGWQSLDLAFGIGNFNLYTIPKGGGGRDFRILGDGVTSNPQSQQVVTSINGKTYKIDWTMRAGSAASAQLNIPSGNFSTANTTDTNFSQSFVASGTTLAVLMLIPGVPSGDAFFSNLAVRQLLP